MVPKRLTLRSKFGYGMGHVLNDMCEAMWFTYLLIFFHKVLQFDHIIAGILFTIGQISAGLFAVFVGYLSNSKDDWLCICRRLGNRKAWHFIGTICVLISFPFIFLPSINYQTSSHEAQMIYYSAFIIIHQFGWAVVQISHLSIINDLASSKTERTSLASINIAANVLSTLVVYGILWSSLGTFNGSRVLNPSHAPVFRDLAFITIGIGILTSSIFHGMIRRSSLTEDHPIISNNGLENNYGTIQIAAQAEEAAPMQLDDGRISDWFKKIEFYRTACLYMFSRLFNNVTQCYIPLYLNISLELEPKYVAIIPLVMYSAGILSPLITRILNRRIGHNCSYVIYSMLACTGCLWFNWSSKTRPSFISYEIYFISVLIGCSGSAMLITSISVIGDLIGENKNSSAFVNGCMSLADKATTGIAIMLIQTLVPKEFTQIQTYYQCILVFASSSFALFGLLTVLTLLPGYLAFFLALHGYSSMQ